jgi:1-acyl-sn-glycerol-3-phosphate acyltransferase
MRDITYPPIILTAKTLFRVLGQRFEMTGTEHVPKTGGVLLAYNHIGYVDFVYGGLAANPSGRLVRFMAKREIFDNKFGGPLMRSLHHIQVDRGEGLASYHTALDYLKNGEAVGIFPEATISRAMELKEFKSGAVRIAAAAGVPLVPVILWGTQRMMTKDHPRDFSRGKTIAIRVGQPLHPTGDDPVAETAELHRVMSSMLDETIRTYPEAEQPPGSWWLPARYGGSAPTLEEAAALDAAEKRDRAARRAARRAAKRAAKDS